MEVHKHIMSMWMWEEFRDPSFLTLTMLKYELFAKSTCAYNL